MISWPLDADHVSRSDGGEVMLGRIGENVSVLRGKVFARLQERTTAAGLFVDGGEIVSELGQRVRGFSAALSSR